MNPVIGIIGGKGRMGKLFADFFKEKGIKVLTSDISTKLSAEDLATQSDIVIVSVPIDRTVEVIRKVLPHVKKESAIMDFTSVKGDSAKAMLKGKCEVLPVHPMFGNSNPIPGQTVILCPTRKSGKWSGWMENFLRKHNVNILKMSVKEHDKMMSLAQGLIHFAEITFADAVRRCQMPTSELFKFTSKASEMKLMLAARVIDQDAGLYGNIQIQNQNTLTALKHYRKSVDQLIKIVKKKNVKAFIKYFENIRTFLGDYCQEAYKDSSQLIDELLKLQKSGKPSRRKTIPSKRHIALLGPENTYTDLAASKYLKASSSNLKKHFCSGIDEVFDLVKSGKVSEGIVPIENKLHGTVRETLDQLFSSNVHIAGEISLPIEHSLIQLPHAQMRDIKMVLSHVQALNQCKRFLKNKLPKAQQMQTTSTAAAIQELVDSGNKNLAAIANVNAAEANNLKIVSKQIGDSKENSTTFIIIREGKFKASSNSESPKTSIAFHFSQDSPGSLFTVFKDFADAKVNMTKIESRPTKAKFGEYIFYLDFDGSISQPKIKKLIEKVESHVAKLKVLGSY